MKLLGGNKLRTRKMKLYCSNPKCKHQWEGELEDGSYFDEDYQIFRYYPQAFAVCPKCGLSTGSDYMKEQELWGN